jgi:hypothetical protein
MNKQEGEKMNVRIWNKEISKYETIENAIYVSAETYLGSNVYAIKVQTKYQTFIFRKPQYELDFIHA